MSRETACRATALVGGIWGVLLLTLPRRVLSVLAPTSAVPTGHLLTATRLLGARHVVEGLALAAAPPLAPVAAAVEGTHAASMLVISRTQARYRRPALVSAAVAAVLGAATAVARR